MLRFPPSLHHSEGAICILFLIPVPMWLLWLPPLGLFFSIIELFTLLWESSVPLAWPSGGRLQLFCEFCEIPLFFFSHWLLPEKFFVLQTFGETGRALTRRVLRWFSHFQGGSSAGRGSCSISSWAFCPCVLPWHFRTCFLPLWGEIWVMLKPCKGWGLLITTISSA